MNRIRQVKDKYQVLVSPTMDYILPRWNDIHLSSFSIETYDSLGDAQCKAFDLPDIDWHRMVEIHRHEYNRLSLLVKQIMDKNKYIVEIQHRLKTPETLKDKFFDQVSSADIKGEDFIFPYRINDVIGIRIINPWSQNLKEISNVLEQESGLKLTRKVTTKGGIIHLYGSTNINTTYEIQLVPTILYHGLIWNERFGKSRESAKKKMLQECMNLQDGVDSGFYIR